MLDVQNLSVHYGQVKALAAASFSVGRGEIVALLGPNGAGKSSALKATCGVLDYYNGHIAAGSVVFDGNDTTGRMSHELIRRGMGVVAEGRRVFRRLSVIENLQMGGYTLADRAAVQSGVDRALDMFPHLKDRLKQLAGTLSGGEQQMLVLGRAMMTNPKILLADEPSVGLSPNYVEIIFAKLKEIATQGVSVLMAEQNARMALETSDRAYVFGIGQIELEGASSELLTNDKVQDVFLGG